MAYRIQARGGAPVLRPDLHHAITGLEGGLDQPDELALVLRVDSYRADRQLYVVLDEPLQTGPGIRRCPRTVDFEPVVAFCVRPTGKFGVVALACRYERAQYHDVLAHVLPVYARHDRVHGLRVHRHVTGWTVLLAELDEEQTDEVVKLGHRRDGAFPTTSARALLDRNGRWNAEHRIDLRPSRWLNELAGVRVEGLEIAALPFGEHNVEGQGGFSTAADPGDHGQSVFWDGNVEPAESVR